MENDFEIVKEGSTLTIKLGAELATANAPALKEELAKFYGQGIQKVVFDASGLSFLSSAGIQAVIYASKRLGSKNEIVFINCVKEIYEVLDFVGLTTFIKFEENPKLKREFRRRNLTGLDDEVINQRTKERAKTLDNYAANNDVVCYSMKMGGEDE